MEILGCFDTLIYEVILLAYEQVVHWCCMLLHEFVEKLLYCTYIQKNPQNRYTNIHHFGNICMGLN